MDIDIENINKYELRNKVNTIKLRPIYEVIDEAYFIESKHLSGYFMQKCKDIANEAQFIPLEMKDNIKRMTMEQGLYAQVVKLRRNYLKFVAADKNKSEAKFKFQGLSARSQRLFDIEFDWIETFQSHDDTQDTNKFKRFQVPIENTKCVETFKFHNDASMLKYCHKSLNSCCLSSLESAFVSIK